MDFNGKVALITGAGNGIGRATALAFAAYKAKVVVVDRDGPGAERTAGTIKQQGGDALAVTADVTKSADLNAPDLIGQVVILRAGHSVRKLAEAQLLQSGKKARELLPPKRPKHHLSGARRPRPGRQHQDQSREVGMIDQLDRGICRTVRVGGRLGGAHCMRSLVDVEGCAPMLAKMLSPCQHTVPSG
jgi:short chain dehydrogenase